jgi:hypothetical protein
MAMPSPTSSWFSRARFGLFVHWGHGSQQGWELSWPMVGGVGNLRYCQDVPAATYHANARTFAPRPGAARECLAAAKRAPWQFYGPATRRGSRLYLHLLSRPYDTVAVRGIPIRRVRAVTAPRTGAALDATGRCPVVDQLFNSDPTGELTIRVPESVLDPLATTLAVDVDLA